MRHVESHAWQRHTLMGVLRRQRPTPPLATGTSLGQERYSGRRCQQDLGMAGMTTLASRLPSLGGWPASAALGRRRLGGRWPAGGGGGLGQARFLSFQAFKAGEYPKTYTHRGLVPSFRWYPHALWQRCGIKPIAHEAVSSCLVSPSLSQNIWEVSRKIPGEGAATCCRPRDHILSTSSGMVSSSSGTFSRTPHRCLRTWKTS